MVPGPITSWCSRSMQSAIGIRIAVIGMSASGDTDRPQGFINNLASELGVKRFWDSIE